MICLSVLLFNHIQVTKRHLTQRLENLDGKLDEQKEASKLIMNEVCNKEKVFSFE